MSITQPAALADPLDTGDIKERILAAARQVFAERGFDAATLKQITDAAGANIAAVNYHFRSKDELIRQVMESSFRRFVEARIAALDRYERERGDRPLELDKVVGALVASMVRFSRDADGGRSLIRLLLQMRALPRPETISFFALRFDPAVERYIAALERAAPRLDREDVFWRYDFALGSIMQILTDADPAVHRLKHLSGGLCDTNDEDAIIAQLVSFITAGFAAPPRGPAQPSN